MNWQLEPLWQKSPVIPVIAGPCSAESRKQLLDTALALSQIGITHFRAGVWKARTMPGTFEGIGEPALAWLQEVRAITGMAVGTEIGTPKHAELALKAELDFLWIGARTTSNPFDMEQIASVLAVSSIPIFVKNPISPSTKLWVGALKRLYDRGVRRIAAIHRGFDMGGYTYFRNTPLWHIALELRMEIPALPIFFDPSHVAGKVEYVEELSQAALDRCYDGLFIESHIAPDEALSDADQQVTPAQLDELLQCLKWRNRHDDKRASDSRQILHLRRKIDQLDEEIIRLLGERREVSRQLGMEKRQTGLTPLQMERFEEVLLSRSRLGELYGANPKLVEQLYELIHEDSIQVQSSVLKEKKA